MDHAALFYAWGVAVTLQWKMEEILSAFQPPGNPYFTKWLLFQVIPRVPASWTLAYRKIFRRPSYDSEMKVRYGGLSDEYINRTTGNQVPAAVSAFLQSLVPDSRKPLPSFFSDSPTC